MKITFNISVQISNFDVNFDVQISGQPTIAPQTPGLFGIVTVFEVFVSVCEY